MNLNKSNPVKREVVTKLNSPFLKLSKLLIDSTRNYALFRGCIYMLNEEECVLNLLASDEDGNWRKLELVLNFEKNLIYYDSKASTFRNSEQIVQTVYDLIMNTLSKVNIDIDRVYFDLNNCVSFKRGYVCSDGKESYLLLDNLQVEAATYCFPDAIPYTRDKVLCSGWQPSWEG